MDGIGGRNHLSLFSESSEESSFASKNKLQSSLLKEEVKENDAGLERQRSKDRSMRNRLIGPYNAYEGGPLQKIREELGVGFHDSAGSNLDDWCESPRQKFSFEERPLVREDNFFKNQHKQSIAQMGILPPEENPLQMPPDFALQSLLSSPDDGITNPERRKRLYSQSESGADEKALDCGMTSKRTKIDKNENDWALAKVIFGNCEYDLKTRVLKKNGEPVALNYPERTLLHAFACRPNQGLSFEQLVKLMNEKTAIAPTTLWKRLVNLRQVLELDQKQTILTHMSGPENKDGKAVYLFHPDDVVETSRSDDKLVRQPDPQWAVDYKGFRFHLDRTYAIEASTGRKISLMPVEMAIFRMLHDQAVGESGSPAILPQRLYDMTLSSGKHLSATRKTHAITDHIRAFNEKFCSPEFSEDMIRQKKGGKRGSNSEMENGYFLDIAGLAGRKQLPADNPPGYSAPICMASETEPELKGKIQLLHFGPDLACNVEKRRFERNGKRAEITAYVDGGGGTRNITHRHFDVIDALAQNPRKALSMRDLVAEIKRLKPKEMSAASVEAAIRQLNQIFQVNGQDKAISYDPGKKGYELNITGVSVRDEIEEQAPRRIALIEFAETCAIDVEQRTLRIGEMTASLNAVAEDTSLGLDAPSSWLLLLLARHANQVLTIEMIIADARKENISINAKKTVQNKVGTIRKFFKQFDVNVPIKAHSSEEGYMFEGDPAN